MSFRFTRINRTKTLSCKFFIFLVFQLIQFTAFAQVNLQTGSATFSIPMFNWKDDNGRLYSDVTLSYNSGNGLKVNSVASNVGEGWSLVAGGVITRMQVGEPDDQQASGLQAEWDVNKYPAGYLYATVPAYNGCPLTLPKYPIYGYQNQLYKQHNVIAEDRELDYFAFQFNGKSGMFILDPKNPAGPNNCVTLGDSKLKITFQTDLTMATGDNQGIRTTITSFTIQDVDGLIYRFEKHGLTKVLQSNYCDGNLVQSQKQPKFKNDKVFHQAGFDNVTVNPWVINSWYLTEIEDPLTPRKVLFNYKDIDRIRTTKAGEDVTYNEGDRHYCIITHRTSITKIPDLVSINFPDTHTVTFTYGLTQRYDFSGEYPLSTVDIKYNGRPLSQYKLNTTYFILSRYGTPSSDEEKRAARLCLESVVKTGVDLKEQNLPYKFDYYRGSGVEDDFVPGPFFYAKDTWGYFNGKKSVDWGNPNNSLPMDKQISDLSYSNLKGLCFLRSNGSSSYFDYYNAKPGLAKNGLLRQIIYPTGGTLTYDYEQNTAVVNGSTVNVGGVHVSKTSSTDGGFSNDCDHAITTSYNYVNDDATHTSSLWGLENPVSSRTVINDYAPVHKYYHWTLSHAPLGDCTWEFQYPGILIQQQAIDLPGWVNALNTIAPALGVLNTLSLIKDIITVCTGGSPVALAIDVVLDLIQLAIDCIGDHSKHKEMGVYYNFDLNSSNPLPVQFKRVEITESSGGRGKTVEEFSNEDDYFIWEKTNPQFSAKQRYASWAYGLPKRIALYDVDGTHIVKETVNDYDFYSYGKNGIEPCNEGHLACNPSGLYSNLVSTQCTVLANSSLRSDDWKNASLYTASTNYITYPEYLNNPTPDLYVDSYDYSTGRVLLMSTKERTYKPNSDQYLEAVKYYNYNETNYEVSSIASTESDGRTTNKVIKYSCELSGGAFTTMNQNNMIAIPIVSRTYVSDPLQGSMYLDEEVTEYTTISNGDIRPSRKIQERTDHPLPSNEWTFYTGPSTTDYSKFKTVQTYSWDGNGNLIGLQDEGGRKLANIVGYGNKYTIASIINADANTDKYAYADFEVQSAWYGWTLQLPYGIPKYSSTCVMGSSALVFPSGASLSAAVNSSGTYIVSFWSTSSLSVSGGAVLSKSVPGINGYTYYEYQLPTGNSTVTISGAANLDEVRLYPQASRMRTVAYDPAIGKISECDENNRITYYEYDNSGRLQFIKDDKKNIIKMYEYNNISPNKQNGCPGIYYNNLITELFRKNDCGTDFLGEEVPYTVPANSYSSTISQLDADAKAENYLLTYGQQNANLYGHCTPLYYNAGKSVTFTTESCGVGFIGGTYTYTVPTRRYYATTQAEADSMEQDDIDANGQANANDPSTRVCTIDYNPEYQAEEWAATMCQTVSYDAAPHLFMWATDVNPISSTYGQSSWQDLGTSTSCPLETSVPIYVDNQIFGDYRIEFHDPITGDRLDPLSPAPAGSYGYIGDVPAGTYDIVFIPIDFNDYGAMFQCDCDSFVGYSSGSGSTTISNVTINSSCNTIHISF